GRAAGGWGRRRGVSRCGRRGGRRGGRGGNWIGRLSDRICRRRFIRRHGVPHCSRRHTRGAGDMTSPDASAFPAVLDEIRARATEAPERPAVTAACSAPISYAELIERIDRLAERIDQKAPPAGVVALLLPNGPDLIAAFC